MLYIILIIIGGLVIIISNSSGSVYKEVIAFDGSTSFNLSNCSRIAWFLDFSEGSNSTPSLRSGPIRNSGLSCVGKDVIGPANINFSWRVDQERNELGVLSFKVDNETILVCSSSEWSSVSYAISSGKHWLSWEYRKLYSYPEFSGAGLIDDLVIVSEQGSSFIDAKPGNNVSDKQLAQIEAKIIQLESRLISINNGTKCISNTSGFVSSNFTQNAMMQNIANNVVFIANDGKVNLSNEINKYNNKVIILDQGVYHTGKLAIRTSNLYILPIIKWNTIIDADGAQRGIEVNNNSRNITLDSLTIKNSSCGIRLDNCTDITIKENIITGFSKYGIRMTSVNNTRIEQNRFVTNSCDDLNVVYMSNGFNNILLANKIDLPLCGIAAKKVIYVVENSSGNYISVFNDGYIRDNGIKCQIECNKYRCYDGTNITANLANSSSNIWSFLAYDPIDRSLTG